MDITISYYSKAVNIVAGAALAVAAAAAPVQAQRVEPIVYTVTFPAPASHYVEIDARIPAAGRSTVDTADQFRAVAEEIAGVDLKAWFEKSVSSAKELDYADLLECFGLRFTKVEQPATDWTLVIRDDATAEQRRHLDAWLRPLR